MSFSDIFAAALIHLVAPAVGLALYLWLCVRMRRATPEPPYLTYLFLFAAGGGWLLIVLTELFWRWSGMASVGTFFLLLISPFIATAFAFFMHSERRTSRFHLWAVRLCLGYAIVIFALDIAWIVWGITKGT